MFKLRFRQTLDLVMRYCDQGASVLDIGAAQGTLSLAMAEAGYKVTWNDLLPDRVEYVKLKYSAGEVNYHLGCTSLRSCCAQRGLGRMRCVNGD